MFFFASMQGPSTGPGANATGCSSETFSLRFGRSQFFLRLGLARFGLTRGSRSRCCSEGVCSHLHFEFVLTEFTDPVCYLFGSLPIASLDPGLCSQALDVPKFMLTFVFFQDFLATDWTRHQVLLVHFFLFRTKRFLLAMTIYPRYCVIFCHLKFER